MPKRELCVDQEVEGVFFEPEELLALCGLGVPGLSVQIESPASRIEERAVFRVAGSDDAVAGTLHKTPSAHYVLVGYDTRGLGSRGVEATMPNFSTALFAVRQLFAA